MHVTYKPEGGDVQRWTVDLGRIRQSEAELIEKRYGQNWEKFRADVQSGSARARRVLLWHLLRRQHHTLRFEDVPDFRVGELLVEHSAEELVVLKDRLMKANLPDDEREQMMTALDIEITEAIARGEEIEGKATSNSAD